MTDPGKEMTNSQGGQIPIKFQDPNPKAAGLGIGTWDLGIGNWELIGIWPPSDLVIRPQSITPTKRMAEHPSPDARPLMFRLYASGVALDMRLQLRQELMQGRGRIVIRVRALM